MQVICSWCICLLCGGVFNWRAGIMEFDIKLEGVKFKVVAVQDEQGIEIAEVYAEDSEIDISYFMDAWLKSLELEVLKQLEEQLEN